MLEKTIYSWAEDKLSEVWGGSVRLRLSSSINESPHVQRLEVLEGPPGSPQTVILKLTRAAGQEKFDPDRSSGQLLNEWASLQFLARVMGDKSSAPKVLAGDGELGFILLEDFPRNESFLNVFMNGEAATASSDLTRFAALMGELHGRTLQRPDKFNTIREQFDIPPLPDTDYGQFFQRSIGTLENLGVVLPSAALADAQQVVEMLGNPGEFDAFTHGDFVFHNCFKWQGQLYLVDFENARFRHALWEGAYFRMLFPSMALNDVYRIPETVWRKAENKYREVFSHYCPAAPDDNRYGPALTAACAGWALNSCSGQLSLETALTSDADWGDYLQQRILARFDLFVDTTREFNSLLALGESFASLTADLRSKWSLNLDSMPYYPAFQTSNPTL